MAHSRSFRGRGISDSQRRKKSWIQITGPTTGNDGSSAVPDIQTPNLVFFVPGVVGVADQGVGSSVGLVSDPVADKVPAESTILRIRGSLELPKNESTNVTISNYAMGIGVMEAGAAQLGAFPNPATPDGGAWDGWMFFRSQQQGALDANAGIIDIKSMRKVPSGSAIIIVVGTFVSTTNGSAPGTAEFVALANLRALILLP